MIRVATGALVGVAAALLALALLWFPGDPDPAVAALPRADLGIGPHDPGARVPRVVVFSDYQCPSCRALDRRAGTELRRMARKGRVVYEVRHAPLDGHPRGGDAARAVGCATEQGAGWAMHDRLLEDPGAWSAAPLAGPAIASLAASLDLDPEEFAGCMGSVESRDELAVQRRLAAELGIRAVPAVFVDGRRFRGGPLPLVWLVRTAALRASAG